MPQTPRPDRESAPRLADLTADLLWPRLFQSVSLAFRPERIGLAFFGLVGAMAIGSIAEAMGLPNSTSLVLERIAAAFSAAAAAVFTLDASALGLSAASLASLPAEVWSTYGWACIALHLPAVLVLAIAGCAVSRMVACDFSQGVMLTWTEGLSFALGKAGSILTAVVSPLVLVGVIAAAIAVGGAILGWPAVNLLGAVLYGVLLLAAAIAVLLIACWAFGLPLLIPAIACEGTDGLDAIQRAFAYVLGRPLRLLAFAAVALLIAWAATLVAALLADATTGFAQWAATGLSGAAGQAIISGSSPDAAPLSGPDAWAARIVHFWVALPAILVWSFALTLYFSASTIVYLLVRQVCDGQDWGELWMPGMIEGTMARAMQARAAAGGMSDTEAPTRIGAAADDDDDA